MQDKHSSQYVAQDERSKALARVYTFLLSLPARDGRAEVPESGAVNSSELTVAAPNGGEHG